MGPVGPTGTRRSKQLRLAAITARERRPTPHTREGDPELLALVEEPYSEMWETDRRLKKLLAAFDARDDRRAVFLSLYSRMTKEVTQRVDRDGFADPEWMSEYLVAFANLYRESVYDYESGKLEAVPDPWQLAFEAAERGNSLITHDAMLGVNAHINYDLAFAVDTAGVRPYSEAKYEDHSQVTDVISEIIDDAQDVLVDYGADGIETVDESLGRLDEQLAVLTIDECRDSAWRTAVAMNSRFDTRQRLAEWINDVTATGAAYLILSSHASDRLHETLVDLEGSTGKGD